MKQQLCALAAAVLLTVMLGSPNAFALDADYPGAGCVPVRRQDVNKIAYQNGTVVNMLRTDARPDVNNSLLIHCPASRDLGGIESGKLAVVDPRTDGEVCCHLRVFIAPPDGRYPPPFRTSSACSGIARANDRIVHLPFGGVGDPGPDSYYSMDCLVPPTTAAGARSSVVYYRIEEF
jgi:hypothetical protein